MYICVIKYATRKTVLNGGHQVPHPFGISVFENHAFFTDWVKMGVIRTNRFNGSDPTFLYRSTNRPGQIVVSHPALQPFGETKFIVDYAKCKILTKYEQGRHIATLSL